MTPEPMVVPQPVAQRATRDERSQYCELAAVDRPLSVYEQADLHAISTGPLITPTSCERLDAPE